MKGLYCLSRASFDLIYGRAEQDAIAAVVDMNRFAVTADELRDNLSLLHDIDLLFTGWGAPILDSQLLAEAPNLKAVFYGAGSVKYIVTDEFWQRGIAITSAYAANAIPVVEYALSQILFGLRGGWQHVQRCRDVKTFQRVPMAGGLGSTVGLVSLGMIGKMVVDKLRMVDVNVIAYDPYVREFPGVEMVSLEVLFQRSDVVSIHTPWLKETEGIITGALIATMRPFSTLINTSRGAVIKENEMIDVLFARPDLVAVLDVTCPEPPEPDSALYSLANVVLTPHIAGSNGPECRRMGQIMVSELSRFLAGETLQYGLSAEKARIMA